MRTEECPEGAVGLSRTAHVAHAQVKSCSQTFLKASGNEIRLVVVASLSWETHVPSQPAAMPAVHAEEVGHCMLPYIRDQILELAKDSLLVVVL